MSKKGYKYEITLTPLGRDSSGSSDPMVPLVFMHENHDDLELVVERVRNTSGLDADSAVATAVGMKLLGQVMLKQRHNPLFDVLRGPIREFIQDLKSRASHGADE
jgi:hypothetical protein